MANKSPVILVHGMLGFGPEELESTGLRYWGSALRSKPKDLDVFEASVGPLSSAHDRACELAAQIRGEKVDYGKAHAEEADPDGHHKRYGKDYRDKGFFPEWSETNPVHLVGHSLGSPTIRCLQYLLAEDFWGWGSNENWVKSITSISGVCNGNPALCSMGADEKTGLIDSGNITYALTNALGVYIGTVEYYNDIIDTIRELSGLDKIKELLGRDKISSGNNRSIYSFDLEHWGMQRKAGEHFMHFLRRFSQTRSQFLTGKDNGFYSLTLQGAYDDNKAWQTYPKTYYFSYVTEQTHPIDDTGDPEKSHHYPDKRMNPAMRPWSIYIGFKEFDHDPIPGYRKDQWKWWENDGAVPVQSQRYPHTNGHHKVGGEFDDDWSPDGFEQGQWYFQWVRDMDHTDVVAPYIWDVLASNDIFGIPDFIEKATDPYWHFTSQLSRKLASLLPDKIGNKIGPKLLPMVWRAHRQDELYANLFARLAALD